jgi:hypothetical protein
MTHITDCVYIFSENLQRKLKDRDIDLFTMAYRDPERENQRLLTQATADMNLLLRKEDLTRKNYNFVNHTGVSKANRLLSATRKVRDRERDWHLLSHLQNKDHRNSPIRYLDDESLELQKILSVPANTVTGKLKVDDINEQLTVTQRVRDKCEEKFWRTHDYDCIKVKSYDPKLQEQFIRENKEIGISQGLLQASKHPHW